MYMNMSKGVKVEGVNNLLIRLKKNIYVQREAGCVWNNRLKKGLLKIEFTLFKVEKCVFCRGKKIFIMYVENEIFAGSYKGDIILANQ